MAGTVDTALEAIDAVVAERPELEGYALMGGGGEPMIGASATVFALSVDDGIQLVFMTGSGDCPSGCIERRYDAFHVATDGTVTELCHWQRESGVEPQETPCVDVPGIGP